MWLVGFFLPFLFFHSHLMLLLSMSFENGMVVFNVVFFRTDTTIVFLFLFSFLGEGFACVFGS